MFIHLDSIGEKNTVFQYFDAENVKVMCIEIYMENEPDGDYIRTWFLIKISLLKFHDR